MKRLEVMKTQILSEEEFRVKQIEMYERRLAGIVDLLKNPPAYWSSQTVQFYAREKVEIKNALNALRRTKPQKHW